MILPHLYVWSDFVELYMLVLAMRNRNRISKRTPAF